MTTTVGATDRLRDALEPDFVAGCDELAAARRRQKHKDSTSNRASVRDCWALIDAILDLHLAAGNVGR
jgi:hypothetical protein